MPVYNNPGQRECKSRLFSTLLAESAHLIWKLRCERAIKLEGNEEKYHSECDIHGRWICTINENKGALKIDQVLRMHGAEYSKMKTIFRTAGSEM
ncbi:hypothetical protein C8R48DRAFT_614022 [Suillus tomentosus]|nr:hypothetical protein C8R48DRAFT_614022 [Suillus tomentosus]